MFSRPVMAAGRRDLGMVLDHGLAPGGRSGRSLRLIEGRAVVERAGTLFIELMSLQTISGCRNHRNRGSDGSPPQREGPQHVVSQREPQQHGAGLVFAAHRQPREPHAARPGIGAFGLGALLVERFARLAGHAPAPVRHPRLVVAPRRVMIAAMLSLPGLAPLCPARLVGARPALARAAGPARPPPERLRVRPAAARPALWPPPPAAPAARAGGTNRPRPPRAP